MPHEDFIIQLSVMEQKAQQIEQQLQLIDENLVDLERLKEGLNELKDSRGKEILASIGRGIFIKAKIESDDVLTDVGGKNFVKKDLEETKKMINEQIERIDAFKEQLLNEMQRMNIEFQEVLEKAEKEQKNNDIK